MSVEVLFWFLFGLSMGLSGGYVFGVHRVYKRLKEKYPKVYELIVWKESVERET